MLGLVVLVLATLYIKLFISILCSNKRRQGRGQRKLATNLLLLPEGNTCC